MNVRQFECFRAVMVTGTMTRAAEILGVSQPAVTNLIAGLEREIGFALFRRHKGRLVPTPEARYFYGDVNRTLESFDQTADMARQIRERNRGRLVIASYPGIAIHFLPMVISELIAGRPNVRFRLLSRSSQIVRELISAQQVDIAIVELPVDHPGVEVEPLILECRCVVPSRHPLARKGGPLTPRDLDGVPFAALFRDHMTHYRLAQAFALAGAKWNVVAETQYFASCCSFVAAGSAVAVVEPFTAAQYESQGLVVRRFRPVIPYDLALVYPLDRVQSRVAEAFVAKFKEKIASFVRKA